MTCPLPVKRPKWPDVAIEYRHFRACGMSEYGALARLGAVYGIDPETVRKYVFRQMRREMNRDQNI